MNDADVEPFKQAQQKEHRRAQQARSFSCCGRRTDEAGVTYSPDTSTTLSAVAGSMSCATCAILPSAIARPRTALIRFLDDVPAFQQQVVALRRDTTAHGGENEEECDGVRLSVASH
jgi:hypothetical protein